MLRIEVTKSVINILPVLPNLENKLQRESLLKGSLFSAKIEGNTLSYNQIETLNLINPKEKRKKKFPIFLKQLQLLKTLPDN